MNPSLRPCAFVFVVVTISTTASADPSKQQCLDANEQAQDLRQAGKLRVSHEKLVLCIAQSCPAVVREDCAQRLSALDAVMPSLVFEAKDPAGNDLAAVNVTVDGAPFADKLDGVAVQADPGEHHFVFESADGSARTEKTIVVREGDKERHVRVVLGKPSKAAAPTTAAPGSTDGTTQRTIGFVVGGAGAVGVLLGGVLGVVAKVEHDGAGACFVVSGKPSGSGPCTPALHSQGQTALSEATASTVGFVAGAVLLAGGATLYLTAPKGRGVTVSPTMGLGAAGIRLGGVW